MHLHRLQCSSLEVPGPAGEGYTVCDVPLVLQRVPSRKVACRYVPHPQDLGLTYGNNMYVHLWTQVLGAR